MAEKQEKLDIDEIFIRKKPVKILMSIKLGPGPKYVSILAKEADCTYSHTVKILEEFMELGIVEFEKTGRIKYVKLTQDGIDLANAFEAVLRKFSKLKSMKKK
ncbi:MAG TPA: hypothetical protein VJB11_02620 [archaeon]|nr:hypothetical protein [archaeon]